MFKFDAFRRYNEYRHVAKHRTVIGTSVRVVEARCTTITRRYSTSGGAIAHLEHDKCRHYSTSDGGIAHLEYDKCRQAARTTLWRHNTQCAQHACRHRSIYIFLHLYIPIYLLTYIHY